MRVLLLNIRHGGGDRSLAILDALKFHNADVLCLTEYRENQNGKNIRDGLWHSGYHWQASSSTDPKQNSILVVSQYPFISSIDWEISATHRHRMLFIKLNGINLISVYFPQKEEKRELFEFLLAKSRIMLGELGLIIGDFNTGKHYIDEEGATFYHSEYMQALEDLPLINSWRSRHLGQREYSWFSSAGNGFRLDHVFSTPLLDQDIKHIFYSHLEREQGISDHSCLVVEISR